VKVNFLGGHLAIPNVINRNNELFLSYSGPDSYLSLKYKKKLLPLWHEILASMFDFGEFEAKAMGTPFFLKCLINLLAPGKGLILHHLQPPKIS
jgi:hypothetical protein